VVSADTAYFLGVGGADRQRMSLCYRLEYFASLTPSELLFTSLNLQPGRIVMLLKNGRISDCLCNGTRLKVIKVDKVINYIVRFRHETSMVIYCITLGTSGSSDIPFILKISQFPERLTLAMIINK